ncbi:MAG: hypothetical protein ACRDHZ_26500 [Ktedonobacteraceae bacterium]
MLKSYEIGCPSETQLDLHCMPAHVLLEDDYFATVPMIVVQPAMGQKSGIEEELYTSFEEAISERVAAVSRQLSHLSRPAGPILGGGIGKTGVPISFLSASFAHVRRFWRTRRHAFALFCLGLNLLLLGFDCMGVLVMVHS